MTASGVLTDYLPRSATSVLLPPRPYRGGGRSRGHARRPGCRIRHRRLRGGPQTGGRRPELASFHDRYFSVSEQGGVAFVLGGGGILGSTQVGMLQALLERGVRPDLIVGTSVGALHGALIGRGASSP